MGNLKTKPLLTAIIWYFIYFTYTSVASFILELAGIKNPSATIFFSEVLFFIAIIFFYRKYIAECFRKFQKDYSWKKKIGIVLFGVLGIFVLMILGGMITELLLPEANVDDENTNAIYSLADVSTIATIFHTLFFACIAEELLYKKTIRDVISNKYLFIVISSLIYALMNIAYVSFSLASVIDFVRCFLFSSFLSWIYVKEKDNIFILMLIKFIYTFLPLTLLITGIGA